MSHGVERSTAYLQRNLDEGWTDAEANAEVLSDELADRDWSARATAIDWFLWKLGTRMLDEHEAEAVIDRDFGAIRRSGAVEAYVQTARHTLAAALMRLDDDPARVADPYQAVVFALSPLAVHRMAFDAWMVDAALERFAGAWCELPGHAFLAMAAYGDDCAIAMLARDAFWRMMLGRETGF
ncbi:MAG: hypothetical protein ACLFU0_08440 [Alphaproteobacteria bacterium]